MATRAKREMTVEEYDRWAKAATGLEKVAEAADEVGGPRMSLVPVPEQNEAWPTDLLPPTAEGNKADAGQAPVPAIPFEGIPLESSRKRLAGWSAERQKLFLTVLAETGQVHLAAAAARLSVRSAQALRVRSPAFEKGWRAAEQLAVGRLAPLAFDRAINGRIEQVYRDGELIAERRCPATGCCNGCSPGSIPSASPYPGSSAAKPTRRRTRSHPSRGCWTALPTPLPDVAEAPGHSEHW